MDSFFATVPRGLEALAAEELAGFGARAVAVVPGGVAFEGERETCYRANLWSRLASRILWRVGRFGYETADDLYAAAGTIDWPGFFPLERSLRVKVTAQKSPLKSLEFATLRVKDSICDVFRKACGARPDVDRANPDVRVHVYLEGTQGVFYLDTSGEALFRRGWRRDAGEAPLRENLAAGLIRLSGWQAQEAFLDPMCGGGTLLLEAAAIGLGRAPGAGRGFGFERLTNLDVACWKALREEAAQRAPKATLELFGSDLDAQALKAARRNIGEAGFDRWVRFEQTDILERGAPAASGVMVANPPYGERLGSPDELARFYPELGHALKRNFTDWRCHFFTADLRLPKLIRLQPARRVPLFNGALDCRLYEFRIVAGAHRRPDAAKA